MSSGFTPNLSSKPAVVVQVDDARVNITVRLANGFLNHGAASSIESAVEFCGNIDVGLIVLRLAGKDACNDPWLAIPQGTASSELEGLCPEEGSIISDPDFLLPHSLAELLAQSPVPVIAMVRGTLMNACFCLLSSCRTRVADVNHDLIAGSRWLGSVRVPRQEIHAVVMLDQLRSRRVVSATEAAATGWMHGIWHGDAELAAWETHFQELAMCSVTRRGSPNATIPAAYSQSSEGEGPPSGAATIASTTASSSTTRVIEDRSAAEQAPPSSLMIRNLPKESTSATLAAMVSHLGFNIEFAYVPARGSRFKAARKSLKYGFVGFFDSADLYACLDAVNLLGCSLQAEASMKYTKKHVVKALTRAKAEFMDPSKLPVLISEPPAPRAVARFQ